MAIQAGPKKARTRGRTVERKFINLVSIRHERLLGKQWPNNKYANDPEGFARDVLKITVILRHQREFLIAVRDNKLVAVSAGQKIGKTFIIAVLVWWVFCTFPNANITITATTGDQVEAVIWPEVMKFYRQALASGVDLAAGAVIHKDPATGIIANDGRAIRARTVQQVEAMGGISGENQLLICDEASALDDAKGKAILGNTTGGGRVVLFGNPTRTEGPFYDAFHRLKNSWKTFIVSSEDVAKECQAIGVKVPGIATPEIISLWEQMWGRGDPFFIVRVLGQFLAVETGKINTFHNIHAAQARYEMTEAKGVLKLGVDPAGEGAGQDADEWGFCLVRGQKVLSDLEMIRGLSIDAGVAKVVELLAKNRDDNEIPIVNADQSREFGSQLVSKLKLLSQMLRQTSPRKSFEVYGIMPSQPATREPLLYDRRRDELWKYGSEWLRNGGAIPSGDWKLAEELHAPRWYLALNGKAKASDKDKELRPMLGRSPDRADALNLAVWEPEVTLEEDKETGETEVTSPHPEDEALGNEFDMMQANEGWWPE